MERLGGQSCPVVGVMVSILQRMAWVVLEGGEGCGGWDVVQIGGGGGGSGGLRGVLTANPIGPMGLPNCSLLRNMMIVAYWITVFGFNCLSNLDKIFENHQDAKRSTT